MNRWHPLMQLIRCRLREFYREPEAVFWVYCFPLLLAVVLGLAFSGGAPEPPVVDVQGDASDGGTEKLAAPLRKAGLGGKIADAEVCAYRLRIGESALTVIPGDGEPIYRFDPSRPDSVLARRWADSVLCNNRLGIADDDKRDSHVTEPGSRYIDFLLPGLVGMNLMGGGLFGIGFVMVDLRVRKLFKRQLATPMRRSDFLGALLISRLFFLIPEMTLLLLVGHFGFGVPLGGSPLALIAMILSGVAVFDAIGLLIGSRTEKTETISGLINVVMLPSYLVSGTFFSSKRFPEWMQPIIQALPLTQINDGLREVMLESRSLGFIAGRIGILMIWTVVCTFIGMKWFKWR